MKRLTLLIVTAAALVSLIAPVWAQESAAASDVPIQTTNTVVIVAVVLSIVAIIVAMALRKKPQE